MGSVLFFYLFAVQLLYCYTYGSVYAECGITVPHDSLARYNRQHPRRYIVPNRQIRRCRPLQRAKGLRGTVMPRLRRLNRLCSSTLSVNCEKAEKDMLW